MITSQNLTPTLQAKVNFTKPKNSPSKCQINATDDWANSKKLVKNGNEKPVIALKSSKKAISF